MMQLRSLRHAPTRTEPFILCPFSLLLQYLIKHHTEVIVIASMSFALKRQKKKSLFKVNYPTPQL